MLLAVGLEGSTRRPLDTVAVAAAAGRMPLEAVGLREEVEQSSTLEEEDRKEEELEEPVE